MKPEEVFKVEVDPPISSHLPDLVNAYISYRTQRLAKEKEAELIKEVEDRIKDSIIQKFNEQGLKAMGADNGIVKMSSTKEPKANDWPAIYEYIRETGSFELLHRRLANLAIKERWEAGESIPGIGDTTVYKLSVSGVIK